MSSISFDATLNTDKLESAIKSSNQTISDWAKNVEKQGNVVDHGLDKMTKSFKEAIRDQKELIKSIEKDVKALQKAYDDATAGRAKQAAGGELRSAKKALAEEQGALLGLQKQQIDANEQENSGINKLVGGIGKWVMGLASVGAALKIAKSIMQSTEGSMNAFERVVAGASAGVQYFFKSIASGDWSNFFGNLDKAIRGAAEFVDTMENLANRQNEQKIKSSEIDIKIAELRDATYDKDESNNEARKKSLEEIIVLQKQKFTNEAKLAKDLYDANLKKAATDSGLSEQQIKNFIKEYSSFEKLIEVGEKYNEITKLTRKPGMNAGYVASLLKEREALHGNAIEAGKYVTQISKVTPEVRKQLADFAALANEAEAAYGQKNRRDKMQLAEVINKIKADADAMAKKAIEDAKTENQIKIQTELLNKAIESNNAVEIKAIGERIRKLQEELVVRQRIAEAAIAGTMIRETPISKITGLRAPIQLPGGLKIPSTLSGIPTQDSGDYIPGTAMLSDAGKASQKKKDAKYDKDAEESLKKQLELRNEIVRAAADLVNQIGQQIGLDEKSMSLLNAGLDAFTQLATGDIVGAATSMISGIISQIPSAASRFEAQIGHINQLLEEQARLIELSERKGNQEQDRKDELEILKGKEAAAKKEFERLQFQANSHWDILGWRQDKADKAKQSWEEIKVAIEDANQVLTDFMVGGVTENTIADVIAQGFQEGKTSVDDFADYMNQVLVDAVLNIFKAEILGPAMTEVTNYIKTALEDKILTSEEKQSIDQKVKTIADANKELFDNLTQGLNLGGTAANTGMSGQIARNITEDTASELTGLWRRATDDIRQTKDYSLAGMNHLVGIESNTFQTVVQLQLAVVELKSIVSNTKQVPVGPF